MVFRVGYVYLLICKVFVCVCVCVWGRGQYISPTKSRDRLLASLKSSPPKTKAEQYHSSLTSVILGLVVLAFLVTRAVNQINTAVRRRPPLNIAYISSINLTWVFLAWALVWFTTKTYNLGGKAGMSLASVRSMHMVFHTVGALHINTLGMFRLQLAGFNGNSITPGQVFFIGFLLSVLLGHCCG